MVRLACSSVKEHHYLEPPPGTIFPPPGAVRHLVSPPDEVVPLERPHLGELAQDESLQPQFVRQCPVAQKYLRLLGDLDWAHFPERPTNRPWPGSPPHPRAPFVGAYLVKVNEAHTYMSDLRRYLIEHPALVWVLGFELETDASYPWGFDVEASVPSRKQLGRVLRELPHDSCQFLLKSSVRLIGEALPPELAFGEMISLDTKHQLAWVAENNPKAYIKESQRLDKTRQPAGDPTCKLGCKKKANTSPSPADQLETDAPSTKQTAKEGKQNKNNKKFSSEASSDPSQSTKDTEFKVYIGNLETCHLSDQDIENLLSKSSSRHLTF